MLLSIKEYDRNEFSVSVFVVSCVSYTSSILILFYFFLCLSSFSLSLSFLFFNNSGGIDAVDDLNADMMDNMDMANEISEAMGASMGDEFFHVKRNLVYLPLVWVQWIINLNLFEYQ